MKSQGTSQVAPPTPRRHLDLIAPAARAQEDLAARRATGKLLLLPSSR